jgi:hypothetical protein
MLEASDRVAASGLTFTDNQYRLDLHHGAARQRRHTYRGARRIGLRKKLGHHFVHAGEIPHIGEEHRHLHGVVQRCARRRSHRPQVAQHLVDLRVDPLDHRHRRGVKTDLPRQIDRVPGTDSLRISTDCAWSVDGLNGLPGHEERVTASRRPGPATVSQAVSVPITPWYA